MMLLKTVSRERETKAKKEACIVGGGVEVDEEVDPSQTIDRREGM